VILATGCSQAILFSLISYLVMWLAYGPIRVKLIEWVAIVVVAFLVAYIPSLYRAVRGAEVPKRQDT
jgi:hypothetical protein